MKEKDRIHFWDTSELTQTTDIRKRCEVSYIETELKKRLPEESFRITSVDINDTGTYKSKTNLIVRLLTSLSPIKNLPAYCEVQIEHQTGKFTEHIVVWSPLAWNDRFSGTAGGGISTGGIQNITAPNNTIRGWTLPYALINGFTAATVDAGNVIDRKDVSHNPETGERNDDLIENWRARSTHFMTLFGKAVAEILHQRPVQYSYMNGGSGGGRQSMVEAQEYPEDYDGIWASCPAINWSKFVIAGFWPLAVMNSYNHILSPTKLKYFTAAVHESVGGKDEYYQLERIVDFDLKALIGQKAKDGLITELDATVMAEIWNGPRRKDGQKLWYGFRPGVKYWYLGLPIGFHFTLFDKKPKPFFLVPDYARWITRNPQQNFDDITMEEFEILFDRSTTEFSHVAADKADLSEFSRHGGKLMIDHGIDDPLIPVDGTIEYYERLCDHHGGKEFVDKFCRLFINPGDAHGNCFGNGPGIPESDGIRALIDWVENGIPPEAIRVVQVKRLSGETICEREQNPY